MLRPLATLAVVAIAALLAGPATAAPRDPDVPRPDPPGRWRVIDHTDEKSTSKCIGNPITPLCTVETDRACLLRKDDKLCAATVGRTVDDIRLIREESERDYDERMRAVFAKSRIPRLDEYEKFRVIKAERASAKNLPRLKAPINRRSKPYRVEIGDIVITIDEVNCWRSGPMPGCSTPPYGLKWIYFLHRKGDQWVIVDEHYPGD
ncbi:MAG: hypothetical protein HY246_19120 [Proteobacteria bacterium]|nr:hypothetical protein [Pseudomonadota bacterium]